MRFANGCIKTLYMHTLWSQHMSQILSRINSLENIITPETLPIIFVKPLNAVIVQNWWCKVYFLYFLWACLFLVKQGMIIWWWFNWGGRHDDKWWCQLKKKLHIINNIWHLAVTNKNLQENNCCGGIFLKYMKIFIYIW